MSWKRTFLVFIACVAATVAGTWFVLRRTGVAKSFVQRVLAQLIKGPFALEHADLDLGGGTLTLTDLQIAHPTDRSRPLLQAKDIRVSMNTNPLGEVGRVDSVVLRGVQIEDLQLAGPNAVQLDDIFATPARTATGAAYPTVTIEDSTVGLRFADTGTPLRFTDVDLELLPLQPDGSEMALNGAMTTSLGTRVRVTGRGDLRAKRFRVLVQAADLELSAAAVAPFSATVAQALAAADLSGHITSAQLWLESDGGDLRLGFQADADTITFSAPQCPLRLTGTAKVSGTLQDSGSVNLNFSSHSERGTITLEGCLLRLLTPTPDADLALRVAALRVDGELLDALAAQPAGARLVRAFSPGPGGHVNADARVAIVNGAVQVAVDADLQGLRATFQGIGNSERGARFPYQIGDLNGRVQIRERAVVFERLRGTDARGAVVEIGGRVPFDLARERGHVTVHGQGIAFSDELRAALLALDLRAARHYDDCAPTGTADVAVRITDIGAPTHAGYHVRIDPRGGTAKHATFPCRVEGITGAVEIDSGGVVFDLTGTRGGHGVTVRGRFPSQSAADESPRAQLSVRAADVEIDDELRAAVLSLAPATAELWPALAPRGRVGVEVAAWEPTASSTFAYEMRVDVLDGQLLPRAFPVPLLGLQGPIFITGDGDRHRVDVHLLRGRAQQQPTDAPADVWISGVAHHAGADSAIEMTTIARGIVLQTELRDLLDQTGALSRAAWDMLSPAGRVDVIARQQGRSLDSVPHLHLRMQLRDVGVRADWLPAPVTKLNGEIEALDGRVAAAELRGLLGAAPIILRDGELTHADRASRLRGIVTAEEVPLNDDLARLFGNSPLRGAYLRRQVRGRAKVTALNLQCAVPDAGAPGFELTASGQLALRDCSFALAVPVEHVDGVLYINECRVDDAGGHVTGTLSNVSFQALANLGHELGARFHADADAISFDDLSLRLCGGRIVGTQDGTHLRYDTRGEGALAAHLSWQGVRLSELIGAGGRSGGLSGNVAGRLVLESLPGTRLIDAVARGELQVTGGRLGEVPLFRSIYAILRRQPQFTSADARFRVNDRRVDLERVSLGSQLLEVKGKGQISMDGYLDLDIELPDLFGDAADFLLLPEILHQTVAQVLQFKLHGYVRDPDITPLTPFQSAPGRRPLEPIPAVLPELPRKRF